VEESSSDNRLKRRAPEINLWQIISTIAEIMHPLTESLTLAMRDWKLLLFPAVPATSPSSKHTIEFLTPLMRAVFMYVSDIVSL